MFRTPNLVRRNGLGPILGSGPTLSAGAAAEAALVAGTTEKLKLDAAIEQFNDENRRVGGLRPKRLMDFEAALKLLSRKLGPDKLVNRISKAEIGELRILLTKLPPNFTKRFAGHDLDEVAKIAREQELPVLDAATANQKYLGLFEAFFEWCVSCGYAAENPAAGVRIKTRGATAENERGTFTTDELNRLYAAPLFKGCCSAGRIYEAGSFHVSDHRYWLPLLGLFTGARLGELCQLLVEDVREIDGVSCIDITAEGEKRLKTRAARREVPIHPELARLGFLLHVESCRLTGQKRLFPEIEPGKGGYLSENPSKWFARFLRKTLGEATAQRRRLVFHSYRHTMKDALRAAGVEERIQDAMLGHETDHVSSAYGQGYKPPRLLTELSKIMYDGFDLSALYKL